MPKKDEYIFLFLGLSSQIFVGMGIYISNFSRASMQKRCRSELNLDLNEVQFYREVNTTLNTKFKVNSVVLTTELLDENPQIWKVPYNETENNCDSSEQTCEEGYVWASPVGFKEKAITMEYTHQVTSCNSKKQYRVVLQNNPKRPQNDLK